MSRPSEGRMLRNEQQPMLELNLGDPLYHVTCVVASVHLNLDSDPTYGCTDEPPTLVLGWTLSITIVDHILISVFIVLQEEIWLDYFHSQSFILPDVSVAIHCLGGVS